jgi:hypothetical protein
MAVVPKGGEMVARDPKLVASLQLLRHHIGTYPDPIEHCEICR